MSHQKQLFRKAAVFTDIHFGKKANSREHNSDCEGFVKWFCQEAKKDKCDVAIFCGDWNDDRRSTNVSTMNYSLSNLKYISEHFDNFYFILGNHDLYYRDKREINSIQYIELKSNVHIINEPTVIDNVGLIPWLIGDEWKDIPKLECKYIFGHFELPNFYMNAKIKMPELGKLTNDKFTNQDYVFSGHFHKRQKINNVYYIGNAFPHNFSDAWDADRGMMVLPWGGEPIFKSWPRQPLYKTLSLSDLLKNPLATLNDNLSIRLIEDIDLSFEEMTFLKQSLMANFNLRSFDILPSQVDNENKDCSALSKFKSVNEIVYNGLKQIKSTSIDNNILIDLFSGL